MAGSTVAQSDSRRRLLRCGSATGHFRCTAINSATMETAISSGVVAPTSRPMGAKTRSNSGEEFLAKRRPGDPDWKTVRTHEKSAFWCPQKIDFVGFIRGLGRGGRIRTFDLLVPNQALYQAEPRPDVSSLVCCTPVAQARTIEFVSDMQKLRELPAVHEVLEQLAPSLARFPRALVDR